MENKKGQHKASPKQSHLNNTSTSAQRQRLLDALVQLGAANTLFLRDRLNILMPASRVKELRQLGHEIFTDRITIKDTYGRTHSGIARYVLVRLAGEKS